MQQILKRLSDLVHAHLADPRPATTLPSREQVESQLSLSVGEPFEDASALDAALTTYVRLNPDVGQTGFCKQLYSGRNEEALLGDWVAAFTNTTMHSFQVGPVATLMEHAVLDAWNRLLGFTNGEGVMVAGGSQANLVAMMLARHHCMPHGKLDGYGGERLTAFVSDQAHYSMQRAATVLGIGTANLVAVNSDDEGRMDPAALEQAIEKALAQGAKPFLVALTAGTTVIGAFDPIAECTAIAHAHGLWAHVDAAWGGPVIFSDQHRRLLDGVGSVDSFAWDAHKLMNVPLTAAAIQVRHKGMLHAAVAGGGDDYLFHDDEFAGLNLGEVSLQCGRRADALKVWLSWKKVGDRGYAEKVERLQALRGYCSERITASTHLHAIAPAGYLNVLFQFRPDGQHGEPELRELNRQICRSLASRGGPYIDYARFKGRTGVRLIIANGDMNEAFIDDLLHQVEATGIALSG